MTTEHTSSPAPAEPRRVDALSGNRPCTRCGFNLHNQSILREPVYDMLIVRCPECATVAALQEYPALGRWATRLSLVLAAAWLAMTMLACAVVLLTVSVTNMSNIQSVVAAHNQQFYSAYLEHVQSLSAAEKATLGIVKDANGNESIWSSTFDENWWASTSVDAIFAKRWTRAPYASRLVFVCLFVSCYTVIPAGVFLAIALPHLRTRGRVLLLLGLAALALCGTYLFNSANSTTFWPGYGHTSVWWRINEILNAAFVLKTVLISSTVLFTCFFIALFFGRPIARALITLLLPPHARVPWAFLWQVDNKPMPRPRALS